MQIPTGMILDRFGVTKVYRVSAFLWSLIFGRDRFRQSREPSTREVTTCWR